MYIVPKNNSSILIILNGFIELYKLLSVLFYNILKIKKCYISYRTAVEGKFAKVGLIRYINLIYM